MRHAVTRSVNLTGAGNFPLFTIDQIVAGHMGKIPGLFRVLASSRTLINLSSSISRLSCVLDVVGLCQKKMVNHMELRFGMCPGGTFEGC